MDRQVAARAGTRARARAWRLGTATALAWNAEARPRGDRPVLMAGLN